MWKICETEFKITLIHTTVFKKKTQWCASRELGCYSETAAERVSAVCAAIEMLRSCQVREIVDMVLYLARAEWGAMYLFTYFKSKVGAIEGSTKRIRK